jgi:hypothetical protein
MRSYVNQIEHWALGMCATTSIHQMASIFVGDPLRADGHLTYDASALLNQPSRWSWHAYRARS